MKPHANAAVTGSQAVAGSRDTERSERSAGTPGAPDAGSASIRRPTGEAARVATKKHVILFLAANPSGTDRLALDREARSIHVELRRSGYRDRFDFVTRWAAEPLDLLREVRELRPTVVHVSGHGGARMAGADSAHGRDVVAASAPSGGEAHGLPFHDPAGGA